MAKDKLAQKIKFEEEDLEEEPAPKPPKRQKKLDTSPAAGLALPDGLYLQEEVKRLRLENEQLREEIKKLQGQILSAAQEAANMKFESFRQGLEWGQKEDKKKQ